MRIDINARISHRDLESPIKNFIDACDLTFHMDQTLEDVLQVLQSKKPKKTVEYFYITDQENTLQGIITLTDLLYNSPQTPLADILDPEVLKVYEDDELEKGLKLMTRHQLLAVPVVDRENKILGVLEIAPKEGDDWFYKSKKIHSKNLREDIFQFIGFSIEQRKWNSPWNEYRLRMPWLLCNLVGGLICAVISEFYKLTLVEFVILAFFIPLVLTLSESVSIQSMTLSLRFLHLRKIQWNQVGRRMFVESKSSFLLGLTSAGIISAFYFAWSVDILPVVGIGISIVVAMLISSWFGALFPIILHLLHLDPKVAAGPVVLMMADIITIAIYLGINTSILT